jgi:hypothetical protein
LRIVIQEFTVIEVIKGDPTAIYNVLADSVDKKSSFQWTLPDNHKFFLNTRVNHLLDLAQAQARAFQEKVYQENLLKEAAYEMVLQHPVASQKEIAACEMTIHEAAVSVNGTAACEQLPHEADLSVHTDVDGASCSSGNTSNAANALNAPTAAADPWAIYRPDDGQSMTFSSYIAGGCEICLMVSVLDDSSASGSRFI